jgi:hypothetical protein
VRGRKREVMRGARGRKARVSGVIWLREDIGLEEGKREEEGGGRRGKGGDQKGGRRGSPR